MNITNILHARRMDIFQKKSHDYADADVLSNFKRLAQAAAALDIDVRTADGSALFMVLLKIDRINNLVKRGVNPKNESTDDSFLDAHNYLDLCRALQWEKQQDKDNLQMGLTK